MASKKVLAIFVHNGGVLTWKPRFRSKIYPSLQGLIIEFLADAEIWLTAPWRGRR